MGINWSDRALKVCPVLFQRDQNSDGGEDRGGKNRKRVLPRETWKLDVTQEEKIKGQERSSEKTVLSQDTFSCMKLKTRLTVPITKRVSLLTGSPEVGLS